jgi:hypothetical protein
MRTRCESSGNKRFFCRINDKPRITLKNVTVLSISCYTERRMVLLARASGRPDPSGLCDPLRG